MVHNEDGDADDHGDDADEHADDTYIHAYGRTLYACTLAITVSLLSPKPLSLMKPQHKHLQEHPA